MWPASPSWSITSSTKSNKVILYLLVAIASFANYLPEIAELLGNRPKYGGSYKVTNLSYKVTNQLLNVSTELNKNAINQSIGTRDARPTPPRGKTGCTLEKTHFGKYTLEI